MGRKITVIGAGSVGASIVYTLAIEAIASDILMIDINKEKALGEAMDISQGASFFGNVNIHAGDYCEAVDSDIVIITSGLPRKPGQTRLELAQANVDILKQIAPEITKYAPDAIYMIVSNPVDVLTYVFHKITNIPENRILGSGTLLDTSRLRSTLANHYKINQKNIHASVLGEHGDSSFVPWSLATISGVPIAEFGKSICGGRDAIEEPDYEDVLDFTKKSGGMIIKRKGATYYAIALSVVHICKCLFNSIESIATVSTMLHGEYGQEDICLSIQTILNSKGIVGKIAPKMTDEEVALFAKSADCLRSVIDNIKI
jgi:L-lactate dehydrogenase